jgi:hypothetical protein
MTTAALPCRAKSTTIAPAQINNTKSVEET